MNTHDGFVSSECHAGNHDDCDGEPKRDAYCTCSCHDLVLCEDDIAIEPEEPKTPW